MSLPSSDLALMAFQHCAPPRTATRTQKMKSPWLARRVEDQPSYRVQSKWKKNQDTPMSPIGLLRASLWFRGYISSF